jgi:FtsZ-interacting cell division protein YlmF
MSGIAFAVNGKITPVSAKTYFITPENVDLLDAQNSSGTDGDDE